jgi:hypothetical protein
MAARKSRTAPVAKPEYEPTPREDAAIQKLLGDQAPRLKISASLGMAPDHPDAAAGAALLMEAIGTTDPDFF